jgi:patatin-like phospholipase domain-containing protein 2
MHSGSMHLSFSGCGFIGLYHVGAAACIKEFAPFLLRNKIAGTSAGAMAAAALIGDVSMVDMAREVLQVVISASDKILGPFNPVFSLNDMLKEGLERVLPADIHIRANNRLHISISKAANRQNIIVSEFESREELINVILASSFIPFVSGWSLPRYKGHLVLDGGYTDNAPKFDGNTITVSPFSGDQDISPRDDSEVGALLNLSLATGPTTSVSISLENMQRFWMAMVPPRPEDLLAVCRQGFDDTFEYLRSRNIIQCASCREEKLDLNLEKMDDWRRRQDASCSECDALFLNARLLNLPPDICAVFQEALLEMKLRNSVC